MATFSKNIETIRTGTYGKDVRKAIADCLSGNLATGFADLIDQYTGQLNSLVDPETGAGTVSIASLGDSDYRLTIGSSS